MKEGFALFLFGWLLVSVAFFAVTIPAGGTAQNGKVENGHFFTFGDYADTFALSAWLNGYGIE